MFALNPVTLLLPTFSFSVSISSPSFFDVQTQSMQFMLLLHFLLCSGKRKGKKKSLQKTNAFANAVFLFDTVSFQISAVAWTCILVQFQQLLHIPLNYSPHVKLSVQKSFHLPALCTCSIIHLAPELYAQIESQAFFYAIFSLTSPGGQQMPCTK